MSTPDRCILIDRDGVITVAYPEGVKSAEEVLVLPFVPEAFSELARQKIPAYVVVHEPLVDEGKMTKADLKAIHERLCEIIREEQEVDVGEFAVATLPDGPATPSGKVKAGLIRKLARDHGINLEETYYVGDDEADLEAAREVGCKSCIVRSGHGHRTIKRLAMTASAPDLVAKDLLSAVVKIFGVQSR
ncbi:MAG: HAD-IIIA family hydrolase [bacterium]